MRDQSKFVKDVKALPREVDITQLICAIKLMKVNDIRNAKAPGLGGLE